MPLILIKNVIKYVEMVFLFIINVMMETILMEMDVLLTA